MRLAGIAGLLIVMASWGGIHPGLWAGERTLDAIRREVREPDAPPAPSNASPASPQFGKKCRSSPIFSFNIGSSSDSDSPSEDCESDDSNSLWAKLCWSAFTAPWWVPNDSLESEDELFQGFPSTPYEDGRDEYLVFNAKGADEPAINTKSWGGRISFDAATNFEDLTTYTGRLRLDSASRIGLDAEWAHLTERLPGADDWLGRGDCNLVVRFAQSRRAQFHSGIGVNWLADRNEADVGFNFTYGVDLFPVDPVVASATLDLGKIGHADLVHFRGTIGAMVLPHLHLYTGYDLLKFDRLSIHSFLTGVEFWF